MTRRHAPQPATMREIRRRGLLQSASYFSLPDPPRAASPPERIKEVVEEELKLETDG